MLGEAIRIASHLRRSGMRFLPSEPLLDAALSLAQELDHPVYDCLYVAAHGPPRRRRSSPGTDAPREAARTSRFAAIHLSPVRVDRLPVDLRHRLSQLPSPPCPPTPSFRSPPTSASCAAPRIPRSWWCRRRPWASPASRSPTATASPASSGRTSRRRSWASASWSAAGSISWTAPRCSAGPPTSRPMPGSARS